MGQVLAGFALEAAHLRRRPDDLQVLVLVPLLTVAFTTIFLHAGRDDLLAHALFAPVMIAVWGMALMLGGDMIDGDRQLGLVEPFVASPGRLDRVLVGRMGAVVAVSLVSYVEAWATAYLLFGVNPVVHHLLLLVATVVVTSVAMVCTALLMAPLFVLSRTAKTFQNSLSYPFYILGGVIVPVEYLPDWLEPLSRLVFLSWSAELLRDALAPAPPARPLLRLGVLAALSLLAYVAARKLVDRALRRVSTTGTLGFQ